LGWRLKKHKLLRINNHKHQDLYKKCVEVIEFNEELRDLADQMFKVMRKKRGAGLACNQVGYNYRMFIMEPKLNNKRIIINPRIISVSNEMMTCNEACLSFNKGQLKYPIKRYKSIEVEYQNSKGEIKTYLAHEFESSIIQHEIDHLNGITIYDKWKQQNE